MYNLEMMLDSLHESQFSVLTQMMVMVELNDNTASNYRIIRLHSKRSNVPSEAPFFVRRSKDRRRSIFLQIFRRI